MSERTIVQKGDVLQKEAIIAAGATVYPGDILQLDSAGKVKEHALAGGPVRPLKVAIEDALQGNEVSEVYTAANVCQYVTPKSGDEILFRLADSMTIIIGDRLVSNGDGTLKKYAQDSSEAVNPDYPDPVVCVALEAVTTSGAVDYILGEVA